MDGSFASYAYWLTTALLLVGLYGMLMKRHLLRKLIGMTIFQTSIILFYVAGGVRMGGTLPVVDEALEGAVYINPLPHVLMLTAIVVSVATIGVGLALLLSIYRKYETLDEPAMLEEVHRESE